MSRLLIIPDEKFATLTQDLKARLLSITKELKWEHLIDLFAGDAAPLLDRVDINDSSQEMEVWAKAPASFVVVWTSHGQSDPAIGSATAETGRGLVNQVFESARPETKEADLLNASDWTNLEHKRGAALLRMAAHPVTIFGQCIAVLTLSRFAGAQIANNNDQVDLKTAGAAASLVARLIEDRLIRSCLGLTSA
jgi:hypothetical protein